MKEFWENKLVEIAAYYSVSVLCLVIFLSVFELVTTYKNWEEIQKGNLGGCNGDRRKNFRHRKRAAAIDQPA
jgi:uncharacterized membrane protein YjfL (UPF0719 family)